MVIGAKMNFMDRSFLPKQYVNRSEAESKTYWLSTDQHHLVSLYNRNSMWSRRHGFWLYSITLRTNSDQHPEVYILLNVQIK